MSNIIYIFPGFLFQNGELIRRKTFFINILEPIYLSKIFPKLIHSEMAADFCEIYSIDLSYVITVKSLVEILQNMNFTQRKSCISEEAHIFWEGHQKLKKNLPSFFDLFRLCQIEQEDFFSNSCGLSRTWNLQYKNFWN